VKWPVGIGAPGNAGVSSTVQKTDGAIGYVEVGYALGAGFTLPYVKNAAGNYVQPLLANVSAAAAGVKISSDVQKLASSITNGSDAQAFPIAGFTYMLVRRSRRRQPTWVRPTSRSDAQSSYDCIDERSREWPSRPRRPH